MLYRQHHDHMIPHLKMTGFWWWCDAANNKGSTTTTSRRRDLVLHLNYSLLFGLKRSLYFPQQVVTSYKAPIRVISKETMKDCKMLANEGGSISSIEVMALVWSPHRGWFGPVTNGDNPHLFFRIFLLSTLQQLVTILIILSFFIFFDLFFISFSLLHPPLLFVPSLFATPSHVTK